MSTQIYAVSEPGGNNGRVHSTAIGGSKPLHRFLKGQPKIMGIIVLIMGSSFFVISSAFMAFHSFMDIWTIIPHELLMGTLFIISGILFILTEHKPTKKTVTVSLALSTVSILAVCWSLLHNMPYLEYNNIDYPENITNTEEMWESKALAFTVTMNAVILFYSLVGGIILIVMSVLAGVALRSTKSQATVVMFTTSTRTASE